MFNDDFNPPSNIKCALKWLLKSIQNAFLIYSMTA